MVSQSIIYDIALIGSGDIAGLYADSNEQSIRTHIQAINQLSNLHLVGHVDLNKEDGKVFQEKWNSQYHLQKL